MIKGQDLVSLGLWLRVIPRPSIRVVHPSGVPVLLWTAIEGRGSCSLDYGYYFPGIAVRTSLTSLERHGYVHKSLCVCVYMNRLVWIYTRTYEHTYT